jgi:type IV secretory pathway VirJ component
MTMGRRPVPVLPAAAFAILVSCVTGGWAAGLSPAVRPAAAQAGAARLQDLPLVEVPAKGPARDILAVLLTGDGGWAAADRGLANDLAAAGIPVVGLNTLKYFWTKRTPEKAAADLERILRRYLPAWGKGRAVLVGYSLGADVLPFMLNRLPEDLQARVDQAVFIGPSETVEFEFHVLDWLGRSPKNPLPVAPEIARIRPGIALLCVYGEKDTDQICGRLDHDRVKSVVLGGGHKMGSGFGPVADAILSTLRRP